MPIDTETLERLLRVLRENGVSAYRVQDLHVELFPSYPAMPQPLNQMMGTLQAQGVPLEDVKPEPDFCPCGHSLSIEHSDVGCLRGCSAASCDNGEPTAEPRK